MTTATQDVSIMYERKILELDNYISSHYENLNLEAIWLFVATLGAWSVTINYLRVIALLIIFFLFFDKVYENRSDKRPFKKLFLALKNEIENSELNGDTRKARLYELDELGKKLLGFKSSFILAPKFLTCYAFWSASFVYFVVGLSK